jgi:hypothetical protein
MLTHNQLLFLFPQNAVDLCKTRPKRCLFGSPDPVENRILLEEQFAMDKERMLRRYSFDIATGRPVTSIRSSENEEKIETETVAETGCQNSCQILAATNEEVQNHCIPEFEIRSRSGRYSPYSRQKRITGKRRCTCNRECGPTVGGRGGYSVWVQLSFPASVMIIWSTLMSLRTICCNMQNFWIPPYGVCVCRIILTVNGDCFQVSIIGFLWARNRKLKFRPSVTHSVHIPWQFVSFCLSFFKCSNAKGSVIWYVCNDPMAKLQECVIEKGVIIGYLSLQCRHVYVI